MNNQLKVSIIIPAYNEEETIELLLKDLESVSREFGFEVIIIDDSSTDKTPEIIGKFPFKTIRHPYNKGYGASLKTGIRNSVGDFVLTLDADAQHKIEEIETLLKYIDEYDMIIGTRKQEISLFKIRNIGKTCVNKFCSYLIGSKIPDVNSGFRIFSKDKCRRLFNILPNGFSFSTTLTLSFLKEGYNVKFVNVNYESRKFGKSTVSVWKDGLQTILLILRVTVLFNPLKVFVPVAILLLLFGMVFSVIGIFVYHRVPGTGIIAIISSLNILFFGILADQIAALRRESKE